MTRRAADFAVVLGIVLLACALFLSFMDLGWWLGHAFEFAGIVVVGASLVWDLRRGRRSRTLGARVRALMERPRDRRELLNELGGFDERVCRLVLDHHERLDASGYPRGPGGSELDLATRILAVCDVYDALVSPRVYRPAWPQEDALALPPRRIRHCVRLALHRSPRACGYGGTIELGIYTFAELTDESVTAAQRLRNLLEEIELADQVGLDVFGIGEHHRPDFAVSSPAVVLAAAAERTNTIRLTSAVSVLSSDDPVRVFQQFATLDLLSNGRAEIMAGRGSFIESFPLFGYDLADYDRLFTEKLEELLELRDGANERGVYPRPLQERIPIWVAVGGTPESAARAGLLGLPMALAIIGGRAERFVPFAEIHRRAAEQAGHVPPPPLSINSHGFVADTSQAASDIAFPGHEMMMNRIGRERGWPPLQRQDFEASRTLHGASFVGSPQEVVEKILFQHELFGHERFLIQFSVGSVPHEHLLRSIELFGTEVAPAVRKATPSQEGAG